jgi:nicotinamidase-related amidase
VQQGLFEHATPVFQAEQLLDCITSLIHEARRNDAPVFFIQNANKGTLAPGSDAWQFHSRIRPQADELVIHKRQGNAFKGTNLREALAAHGVSEVVVVGLVTHGCVQATCMGAMRSGYRVILVQDGHSSYNKQAAELIAAWNQKLQARRVVLKRSREIEFGHRTQIHNSA